MGYNCILYYCNYNKFSGAYILLLLADYNFWYYVCNIHGYAVCTYIIYFATIIILEKI